MPYPKEKFIGVGVSCVLMFCACQRNINPPSQSELSYHPLSLSAMVTDTPQPDKPDITLAASTPIFSAGENRQANETMAAPSTPTAVGAIEIVTPTALETDYSTIDWSKLNLRVNSGVPDWENLILKYTKDYMVPPQIIARIMDIESGGYTTEEWSRHQTELRDPLTNEVIIDPATNQPVMITTGAGLMGVRPYDPDLPDLFVRRPTEQELIDDPDLSVQLGASILKETYDDIEQGNGNWLLTIAHYNAGNEPWFGLLYAVRVYYGAGILNSESYSDLLDAYELVMQRAEEEGFDKAKIAVIESEFKQAINYWKCLERTENPEVCIP